MKVSLITATWNSASTISDTMNSVASQDHHNIEYIVVDGASCDDTINLIRSRGELISKFLCEKDTGIYDALNKGINLATGDVIGFIHSDDVFDNPHVVSRIVETFMQTNADAVYGDLQYVSKTDLDKVIRFWKSGEYKRGSLKNGWMPPHPTFYMKRSCYKVYGNFDLSYNISADYESLLRYFGKNDISVHYIPDVLVKMRVGGESNRNLNNLIRKSLEDRRAMIAHNIPVLRCLLGKNFSKITQFY